MSPTVTSPYVNLKQTQAKTIAKGIARRTTRAASEITQEGRSALKFKEITVLR